MGFTSATAKEAGKKSKRSADNQIKEIRQLYSNILLDNTHKIQQLFDEVAKEDPAKALELLLKIGSFVIPKPRTLSASELLKEQEEKKPFEPVKIVFTSSEKKAD